MVTSGKIVKQRYRLFFLPESVFSRQSSRVSRDYHYPVKVSCILLSKELHLYFQQVPSYGKSGNHRFSVSHFNK
jgi:hypothetical protein